MWLASGNAHTCALLKDGSVWCWGRNLEGQLGTGKASNYIATPTQVVATTAFKALTAGGKMTCGGGVGGDLWCWGRNSRKQLGTYYASDYSASPLAVLSGPNYAKLFDTTSLSAENTGGCAVRADGKLFCWGDNDYAQLGTGQGGDNVCDPQCGGKSCGNGCGVANRCGGCKKFWGCSSKTWRCELCLPICGDKKCGPDGCGGWCGECNAGEKCLGGKCVQSYGCGGLCVATWPAADGKLCSCNPTCGQPGQMPCCADKGGGCK